VIFPVLWGPRARPSHQMRKIVAVGAVLAGLAACTGGSSSSAGPTPSAPGPTAGTPGPSTAAGWWKPATGVSWQWQLSGVLDLTVPVEVYDVDLFTTTTAQVARLKGQGRRVICYLDVGSWEPDRPDSRDFPAAIRGRALVGFEDEQWLDVRSPALLPLLGKRMDLCRDKGFDAVEPDNVDGYANDSGFALTAEVQLLFNRRIAAMAHDRGLGVALKNDLDQVAELAPDFDLAVNEQCAQYEECDLLKPFVAADKPVLHVEYDLSPARFCPITAPLRFSSLAKHVSLDAYRAACPTLPSGRGGGGRR
jgi:hypothetical protein